MHELQKIIRDMFSCINPLNGLLVKVKDALRILCNTVYEDSERATLYRDPVPLKSFNNLLDGIKDCCYGTLGGTAFAESVIKEGVDRC
jgi:hypothetical protein